MVKSQPPVRVLAGDESRLGALLEQHLASRSARHDAVPEIRTAHPPLQAVLALATRAAASNAALLIQGEPGTGKAALARALHLVSTRAAGPFVEITADTVAPARQAAVLFGMERGANGFASAGLVEQSAGGTLFISEVTQLDSAVQSTLGNAVRSAWFKRVGASRKLNLETRLIAASSVNLAREARAGRVRAELVAALSDVVISLPPLRDRAVDIPALAEGFLGEFRGPIAAGLSADALEALTRYHWPGNLQ